MVVNFKIPRISRDLRKLTRTPTLIKKNKYWLIEKVSIYFIFLFLVFNSIFYFLNNSIEYQKKKKLHMEFLNKLRGRLYANNNGKINLTIS
jgi:hypothetical protein